MSSRNPMFALLLLSAAALPFAAHAEPGDSVPMAEVKNAVTKIVAKETLFIPENSDGFLFRSVRKADGTKVADCFFALAERTPWSRKISKGRELSLSDSYSGYTTDRIEMKLGPNKEPVTLGCYTADIYGDRVTLGDLRRAYGDVLDFKLHPNFADAPIEVRAPGATPGEDDPRLAEGDLSDRPDPTVDPADENEAISGQAAI